MTMMMVHRIKSLLPPPPHPPKEATSLTVQITWHLVTWISFSFHFPVTAGVWLQPNPCPSSHPLSRGYDGKVGGGGTLPASPFVLLAEFYICSARKITARDLEFHFLMEIFFFFWILSLRNRINGALLGNKAFLVYLTHSIMPTLCLLPDTLWRDQFRRVVGHLEAKRNTFSVWYCQHMCSSLKYWVTLEKRETAS